ncbi:MAG: nicotinate-nucleotide--dimethylbenzimidazole phosphoribosyltransferase [Gemmataceae bacterium]
MTPDLVRTQLDALAKPPGSLGRLEELASGLCLSQQTLNPRTTPRRLVLFAADHGVVREGVSQWPSTVTGRILRACVEGRSASAVLAQRTHTQLRVVDVGSLAEPLAPRWNYRCAKVRAGTRNLAIEPALTAEEFQAAFVIGQQEADAALKDGCSILIAGEMGIGNTTPASCLTALFTGAHPEAVVGRGAGADDATFHRKRAVVAAALERYRSLDLLDAAAALGGLEIAAMAGFMEAAAQHGQTLLLDGFVATAAALVVAALVPHAARQMLAAHRSAEPGHALALRHLGLEPILDGWQMRLGEGTGALTALPLLDAAAAILSMGTLAEVLGS